MTGTTLPSVHTDALRELAAFPFVEALFGRRSRRFALGDEIPDGPGVRGSAQVHDAVFTACVALQAQYVLDTFGKFPGTVPSVFILNYLQAHHLDLEFSDRFFKPGAYLASHAEHMARWHGRPDDG